MEERVIGGTWRGGDRRDMEEEISSLVGQHQRNRAIQGHGVPQFILKHIQIEETIWFSTPVESNHGDP